MKQLLSTHYAYGLATNMRLLDSAARLSEAQVRQKFSQGYLPILENFAHLLSAERGWFMACRDGVRPPPLPPSELATLDAIRQQWQIMGAERRAYLDAITDEQLHAPLAARPGLHVWQGLLQAANHATQHRSELAAMLTDCEHSPGDIDLLFFCFDHAQGAENASKAALNSLYEYAHSAMGKLLDKAANLSEAQLKQKFSQGYQSIHETLIHLVSAERRWLARWQGQTPPAVLTAAELPGIVALRQRWDSIVAERRAYLASLDEEQLQAVVRFSLADQPQHALPRWQLLLHVANHGMQHRSELAAMLSDLGQSPGDMDWVYFVMEQAKK